MDRRARLLPPSAQPSPGLGTDLSNALRPPQDFDPGCARLSAQAWWSSWGWRRPAGRAGRKPESVGDPPASPRTGSGLCRLRLGWFWAFPARVPGWRAELRNRRTSEDTSTRTKPGLPYLTCPGGLRPPRGSVSDSLRRSLRLHAGNAGAFWWEPRTLRGREAVARRSFAQYPRPQPFACEPLGASHPSASNPVLCPIRSEPLAHRDCRRSLLLIFL